MSPSAPDFQLFTSLRFDPLLRQSNANTSLDGNTPSPFYMLSFHRDRLLQAASHFNWSRAASAIAGPSGINLLQKEIGKHIDASTSSPHRIKVILDYYGTITIESNPTPALPLYNLFPTHLPPPQDDDPATSMKVSPLTGGILSQSHDTAPTRQTSWKIHLDTQRTVPTPFTTYKTTSRSMYETARERVSISSFTAPEEVLLISTQNEEVMEGSLTSVYFWRGGKWVTPPTIGEESSGGQHGTTRRWALEEGLCGEEVVHVGSLIDGEECWVSNGVRGFIWGRVVTARDSGNGMSDKEHIAKT